MSANSWTYKARLNQIESLDPNDLSVIDELTRSFTRKEAVTVMADEWLSVQRVIQRMRQEFQNVRSKLDQAEEYVRELEIEADE